MTTSATGTVVDEAGHGLPAVKVDVRDASAVLERQLWSGSTGPDGRFVATYAEDSDPTAGPRHLEARALSGNLVLAEAAVDEPSGAAFVIPAMTIHSAALNSWWVTLPSSGEQPNKSDGNVVRWLVDNVEAWGHVADMVTKATSRIDLMQLELKIGRYHLNSALEEPMIVLAFDPPITPPVPKTEDGTPYHRVIDTSHDGRLERLLLSAAENGAAVRIQIPSPLLDIHLLPAASALLIAGVLPGGAADLENYILTPEDTPWWLSVCGWLPGVTTALIAIGLAAFELLGLTAALVSTEADVAWWFKDAAADHSAAAKRVTVKPFFTQFYSRVHAKLLIVDQQECVLLGSPFDQGYYNGPEHLIDDPRRGTTSEDSPIHDVSMSVRGPAVAALQDSFNLHWTLAAPTDKLQPPIAAPPTPPVGGDEHLATVQVVRTLNGGSFASAPDGVKEVLEAYLRAIHRAKRFIYIENQYFTNDAVVAELVSALRANSALELILLLNPSPDMPHYTRWQIRALERLTDAASSNSARFATFTGWSHAPKDGAHPKPRLSSYYIHAKAAIVDNVWATAGSANLDGASLDFFQLAHELHGADIRNDEVNCVVVDESGVGAVDSLRRRLWAEHLGIVAEGGGLEVNSPDLDDSPGGAGKPSTSWVPKWTQCAQEKLAGLREPTKQPVPAHILPWPPKLEPGPPKARARTHLALLGVPLGDYDIVAPPKFEFESGNWKT